VYNLESEELTHHGRSLYDLDDEEEEVTTTVAVDSEGVWILLFQAQSSLI